MRATVIQISDSHLSERHGFFFENWRRVMRRLHAERPDLVVNTGDLSINGADDHADLRFAMDCHRELSLPWRVIPGNHDIGEEPDALYLDHPINRERHQRWVDIAGPDGWTVDAGRWRLVGINGFLYGSGLPAEEEQHRWLTDVLHTADGPVGLFVHKPLFLEGPDDDVEGHLCFTPPSRRRMLDLLRGSPVRFVACGHLHQYGRRQWEGIEMLWAPSCAFPASTPLPGASTPLGWLRHEFDGDDHRATLVELPELERQDLASFKDNGRYQFLYQVPPSPPDLSFMA